MIKHAYVVECWMKTTSTQIRQEPDNAEQLIDLE